MSPGMAMTNERDRERKKSGSSILCSSYYFL